MTLKEAGELYTSAQKKIERIKEDKGFIRESLGLDSGIDFGPLGPPATCTINRETLTDIFYLLVDYKKCLEDMMEVTLT